MMPLNLFRLQLMETFGSLRHTVMRIGISVLLALPFILIEMPVKAKTSGLVMVVLFTTFFGSAIGHARLCEEGRFSRLIVLPIPKPILWLDLILASIVSRILPTLIVLGGFIAFNGPVIRLASVIHTTALLCESIVLLVLLGMLTGYVTGSSAQVHLFSALICGLIAFVSGVLPTVQKLSWLTNAMTWNPLYRFLTALFELTTGTPGVSVPNLIVSSTVLTLFCLAVLVRWLSGSVNFAVQNN